MKKIILASLLSSFFIPTLQATLTIGDSSAPTGETFSFTVGHAKFDQGDNKRIWYASGEDLSAQPDEIKKFGLGYILELKAEPIISPTTLKVIQPAAHPLANSEDAKIYTWTGSTVTASTATNPIYGASFDFFDITNHKPTFVTTADTTKLYYTHDIKHFDTQTNDNKNTTELLIHDFGTNNDVRALFGGPSDITVAFTENGAWGTAPSKIQKLIPASFIIVKENKEKGIKEVRAPYLNPSSELEISTSTSQLLGGGAALVSMGTDVTLKNHNNNIYVGLNITTAAGNQGTAILIAVVTTSKTATTLAPAIIMPNAIIASGTDTVLSVGANKTLRIKKIACMKTSTGLDYMVVARDTGTGPQTIYAVPLVSTGANTGRIADFTSITNTFGSNMSTFSGRNFDTLISDASQIEPGGTYDEQLKVGQAAPPLASGDIKDMYVIGDSVYVVIDQPYGIGTQPGTFCSQAIFAADGHIISWTPWTRVLGTDTETCFSYISKTSTAGFYLAKGVTSGKFSSIYQTQWNTNDDMNLFIQAANSPLGGTQGLFNFPQSTSGFGNTMSLLIATGYNSIILGQTGHIDSGQFKIKTMDSMDVVRFNDVHDNRALVAAELAHNGSDHWLFAGGTSGVTVLTDGTGVTKTGDFTSVADFDAGQTWKQVGNFSFVKKLIWDNTYLYILTNTAIYRIELNASFKSDPENPAITTILTASQLNNVNYFLDLIIDDGFSILGTTNGLHSFDSSTGTASNITSITIPNGLPAVTQLFVVSKGTESQRSFKDASNLYILNSKFGTQQAHLNRFVIENSTLTPLNDAYVKNTANPQGVATSFIIFNQYVTSYFTNGSWNLASQYFLGTTQPESVVSPSVLQIFTGVQSGYSSTHRIMTHMYSGLVPTSFIKNTDNILGVVRESTSGALIMTGNFQARINA